MSTVENKRVLLSRRLYLWAIRRDGETEDEYALSGAAEPRDVPTDACGGAIDKVHIPIRRMERVARVSYVVVSGEDGSVLSMPLEDDEAIKFNDA